MRHEEAPGAVEPARQVVEIQGLEKRFDGSNGVLALRNLDLAVAEGEFAAILGPSGCGKSTLLNVIAGFEGFNRGEFRFAGGPVTGPGTDRAVVFQEPALFPWLSVWDNILFSLRLAGRPRPPQVTEARAYLRLVGLERFARHLPGQLSGGMKQRVGIARALLMKPKIFLMDEPFGALDAQTRLEMQELLLQAWTEMKRAVLFITHDIDEAIFLADVVYVMTARPGTIRARIPIGLPRPRSIDMLTAPAFNELRHDIMSLIREECRSAREAAQDEIVGLA